MTTRPGRLNGRFLVVGAPVSGDEEIAGVVSIRKSGWLGAGPKVARLERDLANCAGASHSAVAESVRRNS